MIFLNLKGKVSFGHWGKIFDSPMDNLPFCNDDVISFIYTRISRWDAINTRACKVRLGSTIKKIHSGCLAP